MSKYKSPEPLNLLMDPGSRVRNDSGLDLSAAGRALVTLASLIGHLLGAPMTDDSQTSDSRLTQVHLEPLSAGATNSSFSSLPLEVSRANDHDMTSAQSILLQAGQKRKHSEIATEKTRQRSTLQASILFETAVRLSVVFAHLLQPELSCTPGLLSHQAAMSSFDVVPRSESLDHSANMPQMAGYSSSAGWAGGLASNRGNGTVAVGLNATTTGAVGSGGGGAIGLISGNWAGGSAVVAGPGLAGPGASPFAEPGDRGGGTGGFEVVTGPTVRFTATIASALIRIRAYVYGLSLDMANFIQIMLVVHIHALFEISSAAKAYVRDLCHCLDALRCSTYHGLGLVIGIYYYYAQ
ncbi:unnamed protein product [Protopolystoma xenopodis]|uniref:Uncharacterized protein n=1 Tax=Protopolystoma xenopodis TaxID=117903 RepID=A0A3S5FCV8_9PLAT|nr:unnamed protein product [Protopolystoma xenopodis]